MILWFLARIKGPLGPEILVLNPYITGLIPVSDVSWQYELSAASIWLWIRANMAPAGILSVKKAMQENTDIDDKYQLMVTLDEWSKYVFGFWSLTNERNDLQR